MGLLRLRLYRLNSPLQYLKTGRGIGRLRETIDLKIAHGTQQSTDIIIHRQEAGSPVRDIDIFLTGPADNIVRIVGLRPGRDNLDAFTLPGSYVDTKLGPKKVTRLTDPATGFPAGTELGPPLSRIDILHVEDWLNLVRTLQKELETEIRNGTAEPRDHALHERLSELDLDDYTRSFFNRVFSFSGDDWLGRDVDDIVNANAGEASTTFSGSRIDVKTILRKPGGGRFGKVTFDFTLDEVDSASSTQTIDFRRIIRYDVSEVDFRFTRPGLLSVSKQNKEDLSDLFRSVWIGNLEERIQRLDLVLLRDFNTLWSGIMADYPAPLPYTHETEVTVTNAGLVNETLTRLVMQNGLPLWRNVPARRPQLSGCIVRHRPGQLVQPLP